jgi:hypothetical protein
MYSEEASRESTLITPQQIALAALVGYLLGSIPTGITATSI